MWVLEDGKHQPLHIVLLEKENSRSGLFRLTILCTFGYGNNRPKEIPQSRPIGFPECLAQYLRIFFISRQLSSFISLILLSPDG